MQAAVSQFSISQILGDDNIRVLIALVVALAAIGMASAWPLENGAVKLSEISFEEMKGMENSIDSQGIPSGLAEFLVDHGEGAPGNITKKAPLRLGGM
jgi:hypothetical protein